MRLHLAAPHEGHPDAVPPPWEGEKGSAGMCNVSCVHVLDVDETQAGHSEGLEETYLHHGVHIQTSCSHGGR